MTTVATPPAQPVQPAPASEAARPAGRPHPIRSLIARRAGLGIVSLFLVSLLVYFATLILPGDAATAILGQSATPERVAALRKQLGLDQSTVAGFWSWLGNFLSGNFGKSLADGRAVTEVVGPRLVNSAVLVVTAAVVSTVLGVLLGAVAARVKDRPLDDVMSVLALAASALPEFVVGVFVTVIFSVKVFHWFPAVSLIPPGETVLHYPDRVVLPVLTLVIVVTPYVFRMVRAATIEALSSDYAEVAELKGVGTARLVLRHALPNALAPTIQVIGLNLLYLAGGIVLVETVFNYPGIGTTLVGAVTNRDVPLVQFTVLLLALVYIVVNIATDALVLLVTPRRRLPRS
jgi:peptide/nickel transport system permease protein